MKAPRAAALPRARPCPFCGALEIHVEELPRPASGQPVTAIVSCPQCLAVGPTEHQQSVEQAVAAWIRRHGDDTISTLGSTAADECVFFLNL